MFKRHRMLVANFGYLSAIEVTRLVFPLLTYPYLIRVLTPSTYGSVILAQGITAYYSVFTNFGFLTTATQEVAHAREDPARLNETVSTTMQAQLLLWVFCLGLHLLAVFTVPMFAQNKALYLLTFASTISDVLYPIWYFQGIEKMRYITLITFAGRLFTTASVFVLVHDQSDYLFLPVTNICGAILVSVAAIWIMLREGIRFSFQPLHRLRSAMAESSPLFFSHGFASLADQGGTIVVGTVLGTTELAYYNLAEKIIRIAATLYSNIARTLYPNLTRSRNKEMSRKATRLVLVLGLGGSLAIALCAGWIIRLAGGEKMAPAIGVLQSLAPYIVFAAVGPLLVNVLMFEGKRGTIFTNTMIASAVYLGSLGVLALGHRLSIYTAAAAFVGSIVVRVAHRFWVIKHNGLTDWLYVPRRSLPPQVAR